ncbi:MAG: hypothetical protein U0R78_16800 [Nocardioidaceae bacterium]
MHEETRTPSGARHEVGVDDLFFSTTDAKGIIEQANSVFVRMSRFPWEQLVGAPHNIIRHPVMPGGAFKVLWDTCEAGQPFCAYVDNLAADGSTYGVFATITPLGDGYLSVRSRPFVDALHDAAFSLYAAVRPEELQLRAEGVSAREAAERGAERLGQLLAEAGFPSYDEFIWTALPAEVQARMEQSAGIPQRPQAIGTLAEMLTASHRIDAELRQWTARLAQLQNVADQLLAAAPVLRETVASNEQTADRIREADSSGAFASVMVYLRVWADMAPEIAPVLSELIDELNELHASCAQTRFRIALAVLHNDTVGQFLVEVIDNVSGAGDAGPAIEALCRALDEGMAETQQMAAHNAELAAAAAQRIASLRDLLDMPQMMIRSWLDRADHSDPNTHQVADTVNAQVERTQRDMDLLGSLSGEVSGIAVPLDGALIGQQVALLRDMSGSVQSAAAPPPDPSGYERPSWDEQQWPAHAGGEQHEAPGLGGQGW